VSDEPRVIWNQEGYVATITLSQPAKKNAVAWRMWTELREAFERAAQEADVRCVVVTGAGEDFCSGADLSDPKNLATSMFETRDHMEVVHAAARAFLTCPVPTVARVRGVAAGAGCNLALGCDLVIGARDARFSEIFSKRGLTVDFGGSWALTRNLGLNKAKELAFLATEFSGEEAWEMGLLNRVCDREEIDAVVKDVAEQLASMPPRALALIKQNLNRAYERSVEEVLAAEGDAQAMLYTSDDTREAITAFFEKREPRFTGR
jgi:2-(1,2-epoxy-1,2-dihydrophenyl)acetyl-CoA isomerase